MKNIKTITLPGIATLISISIILLASCASDIGTAMDEPQQTDTNETTTEQIERTFTPANMPTTTTTTQNMADKTTTPTGTTTTTTTAASTTAIETNTVNIPVVGAEFPKIPIEYDKWTVIDFDYNVIHEPGTDYHFPWSLTIKSDTETDLELTVYIIHWGFHNWVGWVSEMPFILKGGEIKNLSGEDIFGEIFYEEMIYIEDVQIEVYIAER